jgi:hypothetical protein
MKLQHLAILTGTLFSLAVPRPGRATDVLLEQVGNITVNPGGGPAELTLKGPALGGSGTAPGFTIGTAEDSPLDEIDPLSEPLSVGLFRLNRPTGLYQWQFTAGTGERLAMELKNDHSLVVHSPDGSGENAVELRPGTNGGVFFNGHRLASAADTILGPSLTVAGGALGYGDFAVPSYWAAESASPGLMAVGNDARAFGAQAVAFGQSSRAGFHSMAYGDYAKAQHYSVALGAYTTALGSATAIGVGANAQGQGATALGASAYANAEWTTAVGASAAATAWYAVGIGGWANSANSWAGAWGTTWGDSSIALGGYAGAAKSFAASSGVTYGDYSVAIGRGTVTWQHYTTALGSFNAYTYPASVTPNATDPLFVIGNGWVAHDNTPQYSEHRSNAFMVGHDGAAWVQAGLTVEGTAISHDNDGNPTLQPAASLFKGDVSVQGVLRVPESGDLSMGAFQNGTQP